MCKDREKRSHRRRPHVAYRRVDNGYADTLLSFRIWCIVRGLDFRQAMTAAIAAYRVNYTHVEDET